MAETREIINPIHPPFDDRSETVFISPSTKDEEPDADPILSVPKKQVREDAPADMRLRSPSKLNHVDAAQANTQETSPKNSCCQTGSCGQRCRCSATALSRSIRQCLPSFIAAFFQPKSGSPSLQEKLQQLISACRNSRPRMS